MRTHPTHIISAIVEILSVFRNLCEDKSTLGRLSEMAADRGKWGQAKTLFDDIRQKTLKAEKRGDPLALAQYAFEEVCAKTLYNLKRPPAPFDPDSAFWIIPLAICLGRELGLTEPSQVSSLLNMLRSENGS